MSTTYSSHAEQALSETVNHTQLLQRAFPLLLSACNKAYAAMLSAESLDENHSQ